MVVSTCRENVISIIFWQNIDFEFSIFWSKITFSSKNYHFAWIRKEWISYSNPSHQKDSDGQSISPYACYIAIFHPKVCFYKAGQGVKVSRQVFFLRLMPIFRHFNLHFRIFTIYSNKIDITNRIYASRSLDSCNQNLKWCVKISFSNNFSIFRKHIFVFVSFRYVIEISFKSNDTMI